MREMRDSCEAKAGLCELQSSIVVGLQVEKGLIISVCFS